MNTRRLYHAGFVALTIMTLYGPAPEAAAQSFVPATFSGNRYVSFSISDDEFVLDRYNNSRYAPNLDQRRRIVANGAVVNARLIPSSMDIRWESEGSNYDRLEYGFAGLAPSTVRTGTSTAALTLTPSSGRTLQSPGAQLRFATTAWNEAAGFNISSIELTSGSYSGYPAMISLYERVSGVILRGDDLVDLAVPATPDPMSVALWLSDSNTSNVKLYARCNAFPDQSAFDAVQQTSPGRPIFMELGGGCNGYWYLSVTSTDPYDRVFHLTVSAHKTGREWRGLRIGVPWVASSSELQAIRQAFEDAAWKVYGASMGTQIIRTYRLINNAYGCDDGWPVDQFACEGGRCDVCLDLTCSRSYYNAIFPEVSLCAGDWYNSDVIAHEFGHSLVGLPDEYQDTNSCGGLWSMGLCGYNIMEGWCDNIHSYCTPHMHRAHTIGCNSSGYCDGIAGPYGYECNGTQRSLDATSAWARLWSAGAIPAQHPDITPDNHHYVNFNSTDAIGWFERLQ